VAQPSKKFPPLPIVDATIATLWCDDSLKKLMHIDGERASLGARRPATQIPGTKPGMKKIFKKKIPLLSMQ
jgi:hypothetical protein